MPRVANKTQMYDMWFAGKFGNHPKLWHSLAAVYASGYLGDVWVRNRVNWGCPLKLYDVSVLDLEDALRRKDALDRDDLVFGESPNNAHRTFQGEVMQAVGGLYVYYSFVKKPQRIALEEGGQHALGLWANLLLERFLDPASYTDVRELLDTYEGCVIEFSSFDRAVGELPGRNTIIWECRNF